MKRYGDPYIPDTSPLVLNWEKSCVLRHLPTLDEVCFYWSDTKDTEMVVVSGTPGFGDFDYVLKFPQVALKRGELRLLTRAVGREMFKYLKEHEWVEHEWMVKEK